MARPEDAPGPHPEPPTDLAERPLPLESVPHTWARIHPADKGAVYFGQAGVHRFDAPDGSYGVLYLGEDEGVAFVETFGHATAAPNLVTAEALRSRAVSLVEPKRPLRLVDLTGPGLTRLNADGRLATGSLAVARRWSAAFHDHPERPDGLLYRARHDPSRLAAAVFERARKAVRVTETHSLADPWSSAVVARVFDRYGFGLL